jgi:hypothetical protein
MPSTTFLRKEDISSQIGLEVLGRHASEALQRAGAESVEVDFGFVDGTHIVETAFIRPENRDKWTDDYRQNYELARQNQGYLAVISATLISRGQTIRVHGATLARLRSIATMLHWGENIGGSPLNRFALTSRLISGSPL